MKHTNKLAYLRQLCCLGLPKEAFIPEFLQAITAVIPSHNNTYSGIDPGEFKPGDLYAPTDDVDLLNTIQHVMKNYWVPERTQRVATWFQNHPVLTNASIIDENYLNTDFYNLVYKPLDVYHPLLGFFTNQGKPVGAINLFRSRSQKPFDTHDQALFVRLLPYVSHAFQNQNTHDLQYVNPGVTGMVLLDVQGNILYQSTAAEHLLMMADYPLVPMDANLKNNMLLPKLRQLCRNLNVLFEGRDAPPPSFSHINGRGRFIFTAYWLDKANREPGGVIAVSIEHQEPQTLVILRALRNVPLSPVQREVASLIAQGLPYDKIGTRLHIKLTTVRDHTYKIFDKLDIHSRDELLPLLLAKEKANRFGSNGSRISH